MLVSKNEVVRGATTGFALAAGLSIVTIPILVWKTEHAPEFFGAFTAAIVAAVAVVLGAYYQAALTRQRDDELRRQEQYAHAVDLRCWLDHAISGMEFIADMLARMSRHLDQEEKTTLDWTPERYRDVVTSEFMNELLSRAKTAAQLPLFVAEPVAASLYKTFMCVERLHWRRGIPDTKAITAGYVADHERIVRTEVERLRSAQAILSEYIGNAHK